MATNPFTVIIPKQLTESALISSTIPETDYPVWSSGTTYAVDTYVIMTTGVHKIYKSLVGSNLNHQPSTSPLQWVEVGPTNRWAAFDQSGGTVSSSPSGTIEFVLTAERVTSLGFIDIVASSIRVQISTVAEGTFYDQTFEIPDRAVITDWYSYFVAESFRSTELIVFGIPSVGLATFTITILNGTNEVSIGTFVYGSSVELGLTQYGATAGIIDYSIKTVDEFGTATITVRPFSKRIDVRLYTDNSFVDAVAAQLNKLRGTPCLWVGAGNSFETLTVFGFYRDYSIDIAYPTYSVCSLQIEGLT